MGGVGCSCYRRPETLKNAVLAIIGEGVPSLLVKGLEITPHRTRKAWEASMVLLKLLVNVPDVCIDGQRGSGASRKW